MNKRELILNSIIKAYLNENNPIGSAELANKIEVIPASTIRAVSYTHLTLPTICSV